MEIIVDYMNYENCKMEGYISVRSSTCDRCFKIDKEYFIDFLSTIEEPIELLFGEETEHWHKRTNITNMIISNSKHTCRVNVCYIQRCVKLMKDLIGLQIESHTDHISVRNDKNEIVEEIILKKELI